MSLRLTLKPGERIIIGGAVVRNGDTRSVLRVENEVPLLREADILSPRAATTPCTRIYLALQLMYVDPERLDQHKETYQVLVQDLLTAAPSSQEHVDNINEHLTGARYYHALKSAKALLTYEQELLAHGA